MRGVALTVITVLPETENKNRLINEEVYIDSIYSIVIEK